MTDIVFNYFKLFSKNCQVKVEDKIGIQSGMRSLEIIFDLKRFDFGLLVFESEIKAWVI